MKQVSTGYNDEPEMNHKPGIDWKDLWDKVVFYGCILGLIFVMFVSSYSEYRKQKRLDALEQQVAVLMEAHNKTVHRCE